MTDQIKNYLDTLLQDAPKTRGVIDMRQELLAGCLDKYDDLISSGISPEQAYSEVIEGIGDVNELLGYVEKANTFSPDKAEQKRKKRLYVVGAGILCFFIFIGCMVANDETPHYGLEIAAMCSIFLSIILIIYGFASTKVKYEKRYDTIVEDIKLQMTVGKKKNKLIPLATSTLWCVIIILFFLISFIFKHWETSWIVFLFGGAANAALIAVLSPEPPKVAFTVMYWFLVLAVYFIISFLSTAWSYSWIILLLAFAADQAFRFFRAWKEERQ